MTRLATLALLVGLLAAGRTAAEEPLRLRVLSYNIHHGEGVDGRLDLRRIAEVIRAAEPDLVALQEVDRRVLRSWLADQPALLAKWTGMQARFERNIAIHGGDYGNAVLSALPIVKHRNHHLPVVDGGEQRGVLDVLLRLPEERGTLRLLATHLDYRAADEERLAAVKAIAKLVAESPDTPALLVGDLNALPDSAVLKQFNQRWTPASREPLPTVGSPNPDHQIDYVLSRPADRWKVVEVRVLDEPVASDHRPLLAVLELLPAEK